MIRFENVTLSTQQASGQVDLLRDITFSVPPGEIVGLVGESGAGKSMVGRLVAGLIPDGFQMTQGRIFLGDTDLSTLRRAEHAALLGRKIVFIPQEPLTALNPLLTIEQSFTEQLEIIGVPASQRHTEMLRWLEEMELPQPLDIIRRYPHQLSGGQCQRVLIAMAFAAKPEVIVADEPTTALDVVTQANVMRVLARQQKEQGTSIILITHDLLMASHVCDELVVLYAGEVVECGAATGLLDKPLHPYTYSLNNATPRLTGPLKPLPALDGFMPGVSDLAPISGCRFQARCPIAEAACGQQRIALRNEAAGRGVRCIKTIHSDGAPDLLPADKAPDSRSAANAPLGDGTRGLPENVEPLLRVRNVSLTYRASSGFLFQRHKLTRALNQVSFDVYPGECLGIVGESGSGKSSIARAIVGMHPECEGSIDIDGLSVLGAHGETLRRLRRTVQIIFQDPHSALNPRRSVSRLLAQGLEALPDDERRHTEATLDARLRQLMDDVRLPLSMLNRYPAELSGGQKQRVNIGRGVFLTPKLLVADEIVSGLDMSVQAQILNLLKESAARYGIAVVLISHDLAVVRYLCQRVVVMYQGEAVEQGLVDQVFQHPQHEYTQRLLAAVPSADPHNTWPVPL